MTTKPSGRPAIGLRSERGHILLAVMLSTALVAIDATILATAVPSIVSDVGGFSQFPWLFSIYMLAQAVSVPLYGKFADIVGRKPIMFVGIGLFLSGSVLCGFAWSMPALIAFRLIQGLGAGAVIPMGMTIIGDIYTVAERAKVQGYVASVWGISSVVGPTLGGVFSEYLTWRWIFFVNVPVAIGAWLLIRRFDEKVVRRKTSIDFLGATLLIVGSSLLLLGMLEGGVLWPWDSAESISILAAGVLVLAVFPFVERRAAEPILPIWVFGRRILNGANGAALLVGVLLIGLSSYVPLFAQGPLGTGAVTAGFALAAMSIGWPLASSISGQFYLRIGFRNTSFMGAAFVLAGTSLLLTVNGDSSVVYLGFCCFVVGIGLGFVAAPVLVAAQSSVEWNQRGVVTGANTFARSLGSAFGIAVFGAIVNASVESSSGGSSPDLENLPPNILEPAIHDVFLASAVAGVLLLLASAILPKHVKDPR